MMPKARSLVIPKDHTSIKCAVCSVKGGYMVSELWTHGWSHDIKYVAWQFLCPIPQA